MKKEKKTKEISLQFKMRLNLDHLSFGWMCPLCEYIYSPTVTKCSENHKVSDKKGEWEVREDR